MLTKVISGGQTGADQGGLAAAYYFAVSLGYNSEDPNSFKIVDTGGYAPKGFKTEIGYESWLGDMLGLEETNTSDYAYRTYLNVEMADGTIIIGNASSPGCQLTKNYCSLLKRPYLVVPFNPDSDIDLSLIICQWIEDNNIEILNIAGNRESRNPDICQFTHDLIFNVLERYFLPKIKIENLGDLT